MYSEPSLAFAKFIIPKKKTRCFQKTHKSEQKLLFTHSSKFQEKNFYNQILF